MSKEMTVEDAKAKAQRIVGHDLASYIADNQRAKYFIWRYIEKTVGPLYSNYLMARNDARRNLGTIYHIGSLEAKLLEEKKTYGF